MKKVLASMFLFLVLVSPALAGAEEDNPFIDESQNFFDVFSTPPEQIAIWALGLAGNYQSPSMLKDGWEKMVVKGSATDRIMVMELAEMALGIQLVNQEKYPALEQRKNDANLQAELKEKLAAAMDIFFSGNPGRDDLFRAVNQVKSSSPQIWQAFFASQPTEGQLVKIFESRSPYRKEAEARLFGRNDLSEYALTLLFYHSCARSDEAAWRIITANNVRPEVLLWLARDSKNSSVRKEAEKEYNRRMGKSGFCFIETVLS